jgi:hypothetical protein
MQAANKFFDNVEMLIYLASHIYINGKVKSRLNSGIICYHLFLNLLPSRLLFTTINNNIINKGQSYSWALLTKHQAKQTRGGVET